MSWIFIFRDGIGFRFWHHYGPECGTGIRCMKRSIRMIGIAWESDELSSLLYIGLWVTYRFELIAVPNQRFTKGQS